MCKQINQTPSRIIFPRFDFDFFASIKKLFLRCLYFKALGARRVMCSTSILKIKNVSLWTFVNPLFKRSFSPFENTNFHSISGMRLEGCAFWIIRHSLDKTSPLISVEGQDFAPSKDCHSFLTDGGNDGHLYPQ